METDLPKGSANDPREPLPNATEWSALSRQADELFGPLTEAEALSLSNSIMDGDPAWFDSLEAQDVSAAEAWPSSRTIRATFLRWICTTGCKHGKIGSDGIKVGYARIVGRLVLDFLDCSFPLALRNCFVPAGISLRFATFVFVDLRGSRTRDIIAHRLTTRGSLLFNKGLIATDGVDLSGVKIGISIFFDGSHVEAVQSNSIEMSDAEVGGSLTLRSGFTSRGTLKLYGVKIGASVDMSGGKFIAKRAGVAIEINFTSVGSSIRMCGGFRASGTVRIFGGSSSEIFCDGGRFSSRTPYALLIEATRVSGSLMLRSCPNSGPNGPRTVRGGVRLFGIQINGSMELTGSYIKGIRGRAAFELSSSKIGGSLLCNNGFRSSGNLLVSHESIGGSVDFTDARLASKIDEALYLLTTEIGGRLYFNGRFRALGQVRIMTGAVRAGIVSIGGRFASRTASALLIDNVEVKGSIILRRETNKEGRNFHALGGVRLYGSTISGDLDISGSHLVSRKRAALHLIGVKITGTLLGNNSYVVGLSNFSHITVGAAITLNATTMYVPRGRAFEMNGCRVDGPVVMGAGFRAVGQVHLEGCSAGSIEFNGGRVAARTWPALLIHGLKIDRYINLCALNQYGKNQRFIAIGGVQISATTLNGDLVLSGAYLSSRTRALWADGLKVGGSILMNNGFRSHGLVLLSGIIICISRDST